MTAAPGLVFAQAPPQTLQSVPDVQQIYDEAVTSMDAHDYPVACPKLEQVVKLKPEGVGARLTLAECYEEWGKLASAWSQYAAAEVMAANAHQEERVKKAAAKEAYLKPKLATITLQTGEDVRSIPALIIQMDGTVLSNIELGAPRPADRGKHIVTVSAAGFEPRTMEVEIRADGEVVTVSVPAPRPMAGTAVGGAPTSREPGPNTPRSRLPGFVGLGVGVAAVMVGGVLAGLAASEESAIVKDAPKSGDGAPLCGRAAVSGENAACADLRSRAESAATMSKAGVGVLVVGGVIAAASIVYLLLPQSKGSKTIKTSRIAPVVGPTGGGFLLSGSF